MRGGDVVPARGRLTRRRLVTVTCAAFLLNIAAGLLPVQASPGAAASVVSLVDDDGGAGLFTSDGMRPGRLDTACVAVSVDGSADPLAEVRLTADVTTPDLAPYLVVIVDRGTVGSFGNCATFTGDRIWSGTLAQMPADAASGIPTGWRPALDPHAVYRFTVTVLDDDRAQDRSTRAAFVWTLSTSGSPAPPPTPTGTPDHAVVGLPTPPSGVPAPEATTPPPDPTAGDAWTGGRRPGRAPGDVIAAPPLKAGPSTLERAVDTMRAVVADGQFPLILLFLLVAFLLLQGFLDRRDPKLALARVYEDLSEFNEFPEALREQRP